jgi:mono/diheme cytochrome c family protein
MRQHFSSLLLLLLLGYGCAHNPASTILTTDKLSSEFYTIQTARDTILHTAKGAILRIPAGAVRGNGSDTMTLEIKEAYSMSDIVKGGLVTASNGQMLSSGGMIYINAAYSEQITITKAISVSIPTPDLKDGMQVYKGEKDREGRINWKDPVPLPHNPFQDTIDAGRRLFEVNCSTCHAINKQVTGPALGYIAERRDRKWLYDFTRNNQTVLNTGESYAICLKQEYNNIAMNIFATFSDTDLNTLYRYVTNESRKYDSRTIPDFKKSVDSCITYRRIKDSLEARRVALVQGNRTEQGEQKEVVVNRTPGSHSFIPPLNMIVQSTNPAVYYQFTIQAVGWYNIDLLVHGLPGFENSTLMVRVRGSLTETVHVFLVIPSQKLFLEGGRLKGKEDEYGFYTDDGNISLPQGQPSYILALAEEQDQVFWGSTAFVTSRQQQLELGLIATTPENIDEAIQAMHLEDLDINIQRTKNADSIVMVDARLAHIDQIKPLNCDCSCLAVAPRESDSTGVK